MKVPVQFTPEMEIHLQRGVAAMHKAAGVPVSFAGVVSTDARTFVIRALRGTRTSSLSNLMVTAGEGLGGRTLQSGRPAFVRDYENASDITSTYRRAVAPEDLRSVLCLPIRFSRETSAVVYVGSRVETDLGGRMLETLRPIAGQLALDLHVESEVRRRLSSAAEDLGPSPDRSGIDDLIPALEEISRLTNDPATRARLQTLIDGEVTGAAAIEPPASPLSARETDVLRLAERGLSNADIAAELGLRSTTVKAYMKSAMGKLGAGNRVQAFQAARARSLFG